MALREELESSGNWLFRWRSYLPLVLLVPPVLALRHYQLPLKSHRLQETWELVCAMVSVMGLGVRIMTVGFAPARTSGRNTRGQVAESLNTTGMYSIVRHPLYVGNFLMGLGLAMFCLDLEMVAMFVLAFWLYYERIMLAEEGFLREKFGEEFMGWASKTPAFVPRLWGWRRPSLPFSLRTVLKREYSGVFALILAFNGLDLIEDSVVAGRLTVEPAVAGVMVGGLVLYVALRTLKKHSRMLVVEGR